MTTQQHLDVAIKLLTDITSEWDTGFDGGIESDTKLGDDLGLESIDIVYLLTAIEQHYDRRDFPFDELLMVDGRHVDDLAVGQVAAFLERHA